MDDDLQAHAYAEADFEEANNQFVSEFHETFGDRQIGGYVLDLGCGPGDIALRFARAYPNCIVHGLDGSAAMLRYGRHILAQAGDVQHRIELIQGRLQNAALPRQRYDVVMSNSLLHHLHTPQLLWDVIRRWAAPEAPVFIMDLKRPDTVDEADALVEMYAANEPEILRRDFYNSLLAAFRVEEIVEQLTEARLDHFSIREISDRHVVIEGSMT